MNINEKLSSLRKIMFRENLDAYIISGTDPHNSEYLPDTWRQREWISGFTGSFGTIVVTENTAGLWTDSRYFIQAEKQLAGTGIEMHKLRIPDAIDIPQWLYNKLEENAKVGIDSFCTPVNTIRNIKDILSNKNISIVEKTDLLGEIWLDRPALPENPLFLLDTELTGRSAADKIQDIRQFLTINQSDYILFSCLDEIAWLYNIRCNDIPYNPVAISYAIVGKEKAYLFIKERKVSREIEQFLVQNGVEIHDYHHLFLFLNELEKSKTFCVDSETLNFAVFNKIAERFTLLERTSPIILQKSVKNETEINGFRKACIKDGVAMTKFLHWMECNIGNQISEIQVAEKLSAFRAEDKDYISDSFDYISAYGKNAALPHYSATPENNEVLHPKGLYLIDSGGQYRHGTTDITRTIPLGDLTSLEKEDYTLVLKGMIALSQCVFPQGTNGCNIDIIARQALWKHLRNYGHGTGHGIGYFLNVHEGPQAIRQDLKAQAILPGMVTSNEPGMYREGLHGIRHENIMVCNTVTSNEFGTFCGFETLTLCHIETSALLPELLNQEEKDWLNNYHKTVYEKISPALPQEQKKWLEKKTQAI